MQKYLKKPLDNLSPEDYRAALEFKHRYNVNISQLKDRTKVPIIDQKIYWDVLGKDDDGKEHVCEVEDCGKPAYNYCD